MLCEKCRKYEAAGMCDVVQGGVKKVMHLCNYCMWATHNQKVSDKHNEVFSGFGMFSGFVDSPSQKLRCKSCGTLLSQINRTLFVGCPDCYNQLAEQLNPVIKNIQGASIHIGAMPANVINKKESLKKPNSSTKSEIELLSEQIAVAISNERYEDAMVLCNRLKALEDAARAGGNPKGDN